MLKYTVYGRQVFVINGLLEFKTDKLNAFSLIPLKITELLPLPS